MQTLNLAYLRLVEQTKCDFLRYLYPKINWNERLIGIKGARGVGKTTMLLQHIKLTFPDLTRAFYVSLDNLWFTNHTMTELVEYLYTHGVTHIFVDEVHRYKMWARELKNIYDSFPDLHIVFTGSSLLQLDQAQADLSRRPRMYELQGMSFREYMKLNRIADVPLLTLDELLQNHMRLAADIAAQTKVLLHFERYISEGYYPFRQEAASTGSYMARLAEVVYTVIENDIPAVEEITYETVQKTKRLLMVLAQMVPFTPNIATLCQTVATTRNQLLRLLELLERAALIRQIRTQGKGLKAIGKPEKILLANPNLMATLGQPSDVGGMREAFFASQLAVEHKINHPLNGDILVDAAYLFEIGGAGKGFAQIRNLPDSYVVADDLEIGFGNKIPLWLFGLLY